MKIKRRKKIENKENEKMREVTSEEERRKMEGSFPLGTKIKSVGEREKQGRKEDEKGRKVKKRIFRCFDCRSSTV